MGGYQSQFELQDDGDFYEVQTPTNIQAYQFVYIREDSLGLLDGCKERAIPQPLVAQFTEEARIQAVIDRDVKLHERLGSCHLISADTLAFTYKSNDQDDDNHNSVKLPDGPFLSETDKLLEPANSMEVLIRVSTTAQ